MNLLLAAALAVAVALVGRALGWLTASGALTAAVVGSAVLAGAGLTGAALLGVFFVSGSLLTRIGARLRSWPIDRQLGGRTARQVLANGGWAAVGAIVVSASDIGWPILAGSIAAAQADTWATEIGAYSRRSPRLVTSWQTVAPGTSGGITGLGTLGGALGAVTAAAVAVLSGSTPRVAMATLLGGISGMMVDSVLGATVQVRYFCITCEETGEQRVHSCGRSGERLTGSVWIDNDMVNLLATGAGAVTAAVVFAGLPG